MATIDEDAEELRPTTPGALLELARGPLHPSTGLFANVVLARRLHGRLEGVTDLTHYERQPVEKGRADFEAGRTVSNEEVRNRFDLPA